MEEYSKNPIQIFVIFSETEKSNQTCEIFYRCSIFLDLKGVYPAGIIVFDVDEINYCDMSDLHSGAVGHFACPVNKLHREAIYYCYRSGDSSEIKTRIIGYIVNG